MGDRIILDGAHNPEAAAVLVKTWQMVFPGETAEIIFAAARDKNIAGVLEVLNPIVAAWHFTTFHSPRSMPTAQLREIHHNCDLQDVPITEHEDLASALRATSAQRQLVAGSLYLVGEALALLEGEPEQFQSSLQ